MSRKSFIQSCIFLGILCAVMVIIPVALSALTRATGAGASSRDPRRVAAELLGADAEAPPTLAQWLEQRTEDDPAQLKIVGTADPNMDVEERIHLLEEAEKNQPDVPKQPAPGEKPRPRRRTPRQPPEVLPADPPAEPDTK